MIESMMTRRTTEVLCLEVQLQPPPGKMYLGQTRRLPFKYVEPYLSDRPLRIQPWRRPDPPPKST